MKHPFLQTPSWPRRWGARQQTPTLAGRQAFASFGPLVLHPCLRGLPGVLGVFSPKRIAPGAVGGGGTLTLSGLVTGFARLSSHPPTVSGHRKGQRETRRRSSRSSHSESDLLVLVFQLLLPGWVGVGSAGRLFNLESPLRGRDNFKNPLYLLGRFQNLPCASHCLAWVRAQVQQVPPCPLQGALSRGGCSKPRSPECRVARGSA